MIIFGMAAARRRMREHQGIAPRRASLPLWRLVLGEAAWALRELAREPVVVVALLAGAVTGLAVLGAAAPGPVVPWPGRVVVALFVGLLVARAVAHRRERRDAEPGHEPAVAATEVVGALAGLVLLGWLTAWLWAVVAG